VKKKEVIWGIGCTYSWLQQCMVYGIVHTTVAFIGGILNLWHQKSTTANTLCDAKTTICPL
jgi:hypothetical protein